MTARSELRMQLAASLVGHLVGLSPASPEEVEGKLVIALGLADRLIALQDAQDKIDINVKSAAQLAAFTTLGSV